MPTRETVRIAAVSDVHYGKQSQGVMQALFSQIAERADVLVMPGDLTDYGLAEEARVLARDLTACLKIPIVAVLGNHDYESDESEEKLLDEKRFRESSSYSSSCGSTSSPSSITPRQAPVSSSCISMNAL